MIERLALIDTVSARGDINKVEMNALYNAVITSYQNHLIIPKLKRLYKKIPDQYKYNGVIYRGFRTIRISDFIHLLKNKPFSSQDRSREKPIESWTYDLGTAVMFSEHSSGGFIIQSTTQEKEVLFAMSGELMQYLYEQNAPIQKDKLKTLSEFAESEKEVMIVNTGPESYNLCANVVYIAIPGFAFDKDKFEKHAHYFGSESDWELFIGAVYERADKDEVQAAISDNPFNDVYFQCDGSGNISVIKKEALYKG